MDTILRFVVLLSITSFAGCDAGRQPVRPVSPHPNESPTFKALDLRKSVESAAPQELAWQGPVGGGSGEWTSAGEGNWRATGRFMIHGDDESIDAFRLALRHELRRTIEQSHAQFNEAKESATGPIEIGYSNGEHRGKVVARIEQAPENSHKLVPDGRIPTHQLIIEVSEDVETGNGEN